MIDPLLHRIGMTGLAGDAVTPLMFAAKLLGALAGSVVSLAYILPRGRREAMLRLTVGLVAGFVFGSTAGLKIADMLGVLGRISPIEVTLMGATFASLSAWWGLGLLQRLADTTPTSSMQTGIVRSIRTADEVKDKPR